MKNLINTISWPTICIATLVAGLIMFLLTAAFGGPEYLVNTGLWISVVGGAGAVLSVNDSVEEK